MIPLKSTVDDALVGCDCVRRVFVFKRTNAEVNMQADRDVWLEDVGKVSVYIILQPVGCYTEVACLYSGTCI